MEPKTACFELVKPVSYVLIITIWAMGERAARVRALCAACFLPLVPSLTVAHKKYYGCFYAVRAQVGVLKLQYSTRLRLMLYRASQPNPLALYCTYSINNHEITTKFETYKHSQCILMKLW